MTKTPVRAFYDGILGGFILEVSFALLLVLYVFSDRVPIPPAFYYGAFIFLIIGIVIVAIDAHFVTSPR